MTDVNMAAFTAPKSDQLNADDLIGGPRTITVSRVRANDGGPEQPVSIDFVGDEGKPYKPCKSMRRVMVHVWGAEAKHYVGRSMTLYCDPGVQFGGMKVGGIRISHMTNIDKPQTMALTSTRAKRAPFTVQPLRVEPTAGAAVDASALLAQFAAVRDKASFDAAELERSRSWATLSKPDKVRVKAASDEAQQKLVASTSTKAGESTVTPLPMAEAIQLLKDAGTLEELAAAWQSICASYGDHSAPLEIESVYTTRKELLQ